ncbi:MAG: hypothetical protein WC894_02375 [Patescibacteria group bacterium]
MFKSYNIKIKKILSEKDLSIDWRSVLEDHREMIEKIQHERLIHLLVTIFVGIVMSTSSFITIITRKSDLLIFCVPLLFLFLAYLFHYRFLENTTQNWYMFEDNIKALFKEKNRNV